MKMMAMGAAAVAALLMSAAPAAAQAADPDALCFVAVSSFFGQISNQKATVTPAMADQTKVAMGFYAGLLTQRLSGPELAPAIRLAKTTTFAMPLEEQKALLSGCIEQFQGELRTLVEASKG